MKQNNPVHLVDIVENVHPENVLIEVVEVTRCAELLKIIISYHINMVKLFFFPMFCKFFDILNLADSSIIGTCLFSL